ncbi:MAG TPA: di-heme oxidoredictase family protein [Dongiaceae bacterium]|nr:di-heme oxidoredictase family protein [Dongiaceae bacterium]
MSASPRILAASLLFLGASGAPAVAADSMDFILGKALFERLWVQAPSSTKSADGLGPLFNARACSTCHKSGGQTPIALAPGELPAISSLTLRVGQVTDGKISPHPQLGEQVQTMAVTALPSEGRLVVQYETHRVQLADGTEVELRKPHFLIANDAGKMPAIDWVSPRLAQDLHGLGLLERIPFGRMADLADPDDLDGDGISGAVVMGTYADDNIHPGRFGWKAVEPDLERQASSAFHLDIGLSTPTHLEPWGDCTEAEARCRALPHGAKAGEPEVNGQLVSLIANYLRDLPAPQAAQPTDETQAGAAIFAKAGCGACHTERQPSLDAAGQEIWIAPYTDLLVHDMGDGLADVTDTGAISSAIDAREWRTAPLWGLGQRAANGPAATLLHDGRARSILEAILWHGGEAARSRQAATDLSAADRARLIAFLESL